MAGFGFLAGKGQMLPSEPHLSPPNSWAAIQKILGWNSAFHLQQDLSKFWKADFPAEINCSIMKNKYLIPCQRASAMACLLCATPVHYKRFKSLELTNLQKSSKSGLITAEPVNTDYICQSWLHDFSSHNLALCQSIISHHPQITIICLFLDVVSGMFTFPWAKFWCIRQSFVTLEVKCSENSPHCPLLEKEHCNYGTKTEARGLGSSLCHDSLCALISRASPFPGLETMHFTSLPLYKQFKIPCCTGTKYDCCLTPLPLLLSAKPPRWQNKDVVS